MRRLTPRGLTLVEIMVTLAIVALLLALAAPTMRDYGVNGRLREGGVALLSETLFAQGEAIKRNARVRLVIQGGQLSVLAMADTADDTGTLLRQRSLGDGVSAESDATIEFGSRGTPLPYPQAASVDLVLTGVTCSADYRCPGLRVDAGGGVHLCRDKLSCP